MLTETGILSYLNNKEKDLYIFTTTRRELKQNIIQKKKELKELEKEYSNYSDVKYAKKLGISKQAVLNRRCMLDKKVDKLRKLIFEKLGQKKS